MKTNEKYVKWTTKDYVKTAFMFMIEAGVLIAVLFGVFLLNFTGGGLKEFFTQGANAVYGIYSVITVVLLVVVNYIFYCKVLFDGYWF